MGFVQANACNGLPDINFCPVIYASEENIILIIFVQLNAARVRFPDSASFMWVEFVVGSRPCSERFFSGYSGFPISSKTNTSKFQFDLESVPN